MCSSIFVVPMTGATIAIDKASAADTVLTIKQCVFAANRKLPVRRQRLVYSDGPYGIDALADEETLGGAGVAQDGTAKLDLLLDEQTEAQVAELNQMVWRHSVRTNLPLSLIYLHKTLDRARFVGPQCCWECVRVDPMN